MSRLFSFLFLLFIVACTSDNEESYFGCMDDTAMNYNPAANVDDDSCLFAEGCMDIEACNFNEYAIIDDGSCEYADNPGWNNDIQSIISDKCHACHDQTEVGYNALSESTKLEDYINGDYNNDNGSYSIMPPPSNDDDDAALTELEKCQILTWMTNGFPK